MQTEGFSPKDQITLQFMKLLREVLDFELKYYSFSYLEEKSLINGNY